MQHSPSSLAQDIIKRRILLVDDEEMLTRLLKMSLERTGRYLVHTVNAPLETFAAIADFQPELIVLDIIMPELTGIQLAGLLRGDPKTSHLPIIFLSGCDASCVQGFPFLHKPATLDQIMRTIEEEASRSQPAPGSNSSDSART